MNNATLRTAGISLCLAGALAAQQVNEQQHMQWGSVFINGVQVNREFSEYDFYFRVTSGSGDPIPNEEFFQLYDNDDSNGWGWTNGSTADVTVNGVFLHIADEDIATSHEVGINIYGEDPLNEDEPDLANPIAQFVLASASTTTIMGGVDVEYDLNLPGPEIVPAGQTIFLSLVMGEPAPAAPEIIETDGDSLLPGQLLYDGAPAGASQDTGATTTVRGLFGHGNGTVGGYGFIDDITATGVGLDFFTESQFVATFTATQTSFSAGARTNQATLLTSNPGATPGFTTSFASAHHPAIVSRTDDVVFIARDQDPVLQDPNLPHAAVTLLQIGGITTPLDIAPIFLPSGVNGGICLNLAVPPIQLTNQIGNPFDADGYFIVDLLSNSAIAAASGSLTEISAQLLVVDVTLTQTLLLRTSGCVNVYIE